MTVSYTQFFRFGIPDFNTGPWHADFDTLVRHIDRVLYDILLASNIDPWANSTVYAVGDMVVSAEDGRIYVAQVAHTSAATPTLFSADRVAHPTFWALLTGSAEAQQIITLAGANTVGNGVTSVIINKVAPSATPIQLPLMADYIPAELSITDFGGNGGDITITPGAGEKIHGLGIGVPWVVGSGGAGLGGSIRLKKVTGVGWAIVS